MEKYFFPLDIVTCNKYSAILVTIDWAFFFEQRNQTSSQPIPVFIVNVIFDV